jgi:hypothetical protein
MTKPELAAVKDDAGAVRFERELARLMRESPTVELAPQAGLADVMRRIERREARRRFLAWPWRAGLGPAAVRPLALAVGIQAVVIVMLTGVLWVGLRARPATYRTLSSPATFTVAPSVTAGPASSLVRLVLADDMTLGELRTALMPWPSRIVDGPTARGIYTIAIDGNVGAALAALRSTPGVLLAEEVSLP